MNGENINDAELDAFLKGEDALSGELQAMQQASPSAELDAAILTRAQAQMARDSRPAAANDAGSQARSSHLGLRWRVPAGIAATLMAGVLARQAWQASADIDRVATVPAPIASPAPLEAPQPAPAPAPIASPAPLEAPQPTPAQAAAPPRAIVPAPHRGVPAPAPQVVAAPPAAPAPPPDSPAPAVADLAREQQQAPRREEAAARRSAEPHSSMAAAAKAKAMAPGAPDPGAWLAAIDESLRAGLRRDTLEEWDKFRAAYPDYPVPAETTDKINALRK